MNLRLTLARGLVPWAFVGCASVEGVTPGVDPEPHTEVTAPDAAPDRHDRRHDRGRWRLPRRGPTQLDRVPAHTSCGRTRGHSGGRPRGDVARVVQGASRQETLRGHRPLDRERQGEPHVAVVPTTGSSADATATAVGRSTVWCARRPAGARALDISGCLPRLAARADDPPAEGAGPRHRSREGCPPPSAHV